jgi:hypothetical protein
MNAFNNVNLAAAILLTSKEHAIELGVPESRWIYPLGGAGTQDRQHCAEFGLFFSPPFCHRKS